ncbi:hypothetical protein EG328_010442 [Venturia inaequalis]|uniref:C6 transcription factor RegA n=1 Tax=Venturia inaequalis TaxID=5025 RepID=A0A8H3V6F6_VENIN|nr:hypothetical protein EG328_010442 [Venturia inaequalis]RDI78969.1 hypothetical protein Vi05172_g11041 [Venturia inaequalis]
MPAAPKNPSQALFQCGDCKQSYTRVDHLARHVRSHTQEKPYRCLVCNKRFARTDLLKRHGSVHEPVNADSPKRQRRQDSARVAQACVACAENHVRCEESKPCERCQKKGIPCRSADQMDDESSGNAEAVSGLLQLSQEPVLPPHLNATNNLQHLTMKEDSTRLPDMDTQGIASNAQNRSLEFEQQDTTYPTLPPDTGQENQWNFQQPAPMASNPPLMTAQAEAVQDLPGFLRGVLPAPPDATYSLSMPGYISGTWTPRGLLGFGFESNLELNDVDFSFLGNYNANIPFDIETPRSDLAPTTRAGDQATASRSEAFRTSVWRFIPRPHDHAAAEQQHLSLPDVAQGHDSPETRIRLDRRTTSEKLDQCCRDKIIAIVLSTCKRETMFRSVSAFPSVELLDIVLQFYLTSPLSGADSWLHIPTFCSTTKDRTEVLLSSIAAGAVLTPDNSLRKLGFALQEANRVYLGDRFENDNSLILELQLKQAFLLSLEIGLWSGNSRKIELAESFVQPLHTMLRRNGKYRRSSYPAIVPKRDDSGKELAQKWAQWVNQESYIRLVFRAFEFSAQASMALLTTPLVSYSELLLPLPAPKDIWLAPDAESWKRAILSKPDPTARRPSLLDCLNGLDILSSADVIDQTDSCSAFLHAAWSLVWEYRQLASVVKRPSYHWDNSLIMASRYQELVKLLQSFRFICAELPNSTRERLNMTLELILMHLHLSLEDLQLWAGLEGQEEAARVLPSLQAWVRTSTSRQAIWHAGQVLRAAKLLPPRFIHNFSSIAVYHSALAVWSYKLILQAEDGNGQEQQVLLTSLPVIWLDHHDSQDVQRFIALAHGTPSIRGSPGSSPSTYDPNSVLDAAMEILHANHILNSGARPPLVENLIQLMKGLRTASKAPPS